MQSGLACNRPLSLGIAELVNNVLQMKQCLMQSGLACNRPLSMGKLGVAELVNNVLQMKQCLMQSGLACNRPLSMGNEQKRSFSKVSNACKLIPVSGFVITSEVANFLLIF